MIRGACTLLTFAFLPLPTACDALSTAQVMTFYPCFCYDDMRYALLKSFYMTGWGGVGLMLHVKCFCGIAVSSTQ